MKLLPRARISPPLCRLPLFLLLVSVPAHTQEPDLQTGTADPPVESPSAIPDNPDPAARARGFFGVMVTDLRPDVRAQTLLREGEGLQVALVAPASPALAAGIQTHDILLRLDDQILVSQSQFVRLIENAGAGSEIELTLLHRGAERKTRATLALPPPRPVSAAPSLPGPDTSAMLGHIVDTLRDNPSAVEAVYRMLSTPSAAAPDSPRHERFARVTRECAEGSEELVLRDTGPWVRIFDPAGRLLFEGPAATPDQCAAVPAPLRHRLEKIKAEADTLLRQRGEKAAGD